MYVYKARCPGHLDGRVGLRKRDARDVPARFSTLRNSFVNLVREPFCLFARKTGKLRDYASDKPHGAELVSPTGFLTCCVTAHCTSKRSVLPKQSRPASIELSALVTIYAFIRCSGQVWPKEANSSRFSGAKSGRVS